MPSSPRSRLRGNPQSDRRLGSLRGAAREPGRAHGRLRPPAGAAGGARRGAAGAVAAQVAAGGGERAVERHRSRGKLLARERIDRLVDPGTAFLELNALAAWDVYDGQAPSAGIVTGIGVVEGRAVRDRRERRDGEGRLVLPADGEEASPRAGGGRAEPAAVPLSRRLGRGVPAVAGRGLPRPRALRPHLLQPGAHVGEGDPADRGRDGLVHGRRCVRAGDERRDGDRARDGHDLHRRPAAREGGDRPGRDRRGARRRRRARAPVGSRRPLREPATSTHSRSRGGSSRTRMRGDRSCRGRASGGAARASTLPISTA